MSTDKSITSIDSGFESSDVKAFNQAYLTALLPFPSDKTLAVPYNNPYNKQELFSHLQETYFNKINDQEDTALQNLLILLKKEIDEHKDRWHLAAKHSNDLMNFIGLTCAFLDAVIQILAIPLPHLRVIPMLGKVVNATWTGVDGLFGIAVGGDLGKKRQIIEASVIIIFSAMLLGATIAAAVVASALMSSIVNAVFISTMALACAIEIAHVFEADKTIVALEDELLQKITALKDETDDTTKISLQGEIDVLKDRIASEKYQRTEHVKNAWLWGLTTVFFAASVVTAALIGSAATFGALPLALAIICSVLYFARFHMNKNAAGMQTTGPSTQVMSKQDLTNLENKITDDRQKRSCSCFSGVTTLFGRKKSAAGLSDDSTAADRALLIPSPALPS